MSKKKQLAAQQSDEDNKNIDVAEKGRRSFVTNAVAKIAAVVGITIVGNVLAQGDPKYRVIKKPGKPVSRGNITKLKISRSASRQVRLSKFRLAKEDLLGKVGRSKKLSATQKIDLKNIVNSRALNDLINTHGGGEVGASINVVVTGTGTVSIS